MATARVCDVYGTARDVRTVGITIFEVSKNDGGTTDERLLTITADLGPRALGRLTNKIEAAVKEPPQRVRRKVES